MWCWSGVSTRWGRSGTDLLATLQEGEHLGVVSLTEAAGPKHAQSDAPWLGYWPYSRRSNARSCRNEPRRVRRFYCENRHGMVSTRHGRDGGSLNQAAMPNSSPMKLACAMESSLGIHRTRPFRIICIASIPCNVRHAVANEP